MRVSGWSIHLPGVDGACVPEQAGSLLGRKGLLAKEPATRLALCAVHRALKMAIGERVDGPIRTDTAVVASSNLGNVATVAEVTHLVATEGGRAVSPMSAPNASSNVLAGTVAMWFKFGGPNLMICSGPNSGYDALRLGMLLLRSKRAARVVVVGAEPDDPVAVSLQADLRAGAACVILSLDEGGLLLRQEAQGVNEGYGTQGIIDVAAAAERASATGEAVSAGRLTLVPA